LNNERLTTIKNNCECLSGFINMMILSEIDSCDIDIYDNHYEIFCDLIDENQSSIINKIGNTPYIFLRLELADRLSCDDKNID
jgi:hypothetical protein